MHNGQQQEQAQMVVRERDTGEIGVWIQSGHISGLVRLSRDTYRAEARVIPRAGLLITLRGTFVFALKWGDKKIKRHFKVVVITLNTRTSGIKAAGIETYLHNTRVH
jgi:hypothetical protein